MTSEIMQALQKADGHMGKPNRTRSDKSKAVAALEEAKRHLDTLIATLKVQQR
jgi:hypothetical protein